MEKWGKWGEREVRDHNVLGHKFGFIRASKAR